MVNLFIGMGGSGIKTIRNIKQNQSDVEARNNHFLFIDTDSKEFKDLNPDDYLDLGDANIVNYLDRNTSNDPVRKKLNDWFDTACRPILTNAPLREGASAIRPQGRASVAEKNREFTSKITTKIERLTSLVNQKSVERQEVNIYIVFSVAGGTGSSIFLDLSYMINDAITLKNNFQTLINYKPWAIMFMPDGFQQFNLDKPWVARDYYTNVFATWKEIDAVVRDFYINGHESNSGQMNLKAKGTSAFSEFALAYNENNKGNFTFTPFENAVLFDYQNEKGQEISLKNGQLYRNVAQFLLFISTEFGGDFRSAFNNSLRRHAFESINQRANWVKCFTSAGYTELRSASFMFDKFVQFKLKQSVYQGLLGEQQKEANEIDGLVKKIMADYLLSRIETDGFKDYSNKALAGSESLNNLVEVQKRKIFSYYEDMSAESDKIPDIKTSAETMKENFNSISQTLAVKLQDYVLQNGFNNRKAAENFLADLYTNLSSIVISDGLQLAKQILDRLDEKIDELHGFYERELNTLSDKKVVNQDELCNKDLLKQIEMQYNRIVAGEGAPLLKKEKWYMSQLVQYKELIQAFVTYKANEVSLQAKKDICMQISLGSHGDMLARRRVRELISKINTVIDIDLYNQSRDLIDNFRKYTDDPLTRLVPDVSSYARDFENPDVNIFLQLYQTSCGLSFKQSGSPRAINRKKSSESSPNLKTLEEFLGQILQDRELLISIFNSDSSVDVFMNAFSMLVQKFISVQNLRSILPDYSKISNLKLSDWADKYPNDFKRYKSDFRSRANVFCNITKNFSFSELWVCNSDNEHLCQEILTHNSNDSQVTLTKAKTSEDVIALIKMAENISFGDYVNYKQYKNAYENAMRNMPDTIFPHLDVRFKRELKNYPNSLEDNSLLANFMQQASDRNNPPDPGGNTDKFQNAMDSYGKLYFLAKFYESFQTGKIDLTNLIERVSTHSFVNPPTVPVYFDKEQIRFHAVTKTHWATLNISSSESEQSTIPLYTADLLRGDYLRSAFQNEEIMSWNDLNLFRDSFVTQVDSVRGLKLKLKSHRAEIDQYIRNAVADFSKHVTTVLPSDEQTKQAMVAAFRKVTEDLAGL